MPDKRNTVLVSVWLAEVSEADHYASLEEMRRLASTLGFHVVHIVTQKRDGLAASAVLGEGKLKDLARITGGSGIVPSHGGARTRGSDEAEDSDSDNHRPITPEEHDAWASDVVKNAGNPRAVTPEAKQKRRPERDEPDEDDSPEWAVIVDNEITARQVRNLERATGAEVFDRPGIIIEIFHRHARTREARLQVELARLAYEAPRLRDKPSRSNRQRAGGTGGPGESELELDRRRIRDRMAVLKQELAAIGQQQGTRRARRGVENKVALVGYTNAGKSSIMRALTGSEVLVADQLFATLGPTVRALTVATPPRVLVSDTVGFIKNLPHDLVASFRSTLDEANDASYLLFVCDASDPAFRSHLGVTRQVLGDIGVDLSLGQLIFNKRDMLSAEHQASLTHEFPEALFVSSQDPQDMQKLRDHLQDFFARDWKEATFSIPYTLQTLVRDLHESTRVLKEEYDGDGACMQVQGDRTVLANAAQQIEEHRKKAPPWQDQN